MLATYNWIVSLKNVVAVISHHFWNRLGATADLHTDLESENMIGV